MKRPFAWLALPLILCVLIFAVKWRQDNPTATQQDLEIRAMMSHPGSVIVSEGLVGQTAFKKYGVLSPAESKQIIDNFFHYPGLPRTRPFNTGANGIIEIMFDHNLPLTNNVNSVKISLNSGSSFSYVMVAQQRRRSNGTIYYPHPASIKRWMKILLENPRIGPKIRANRE